MSVPSRYEARPLTTNLDSSDRIFRSDTIPIFGTSGNNGVLLRVTPREPSGQGALLGWVHVSLGVIGLGGQFSVYTQALPPELDFVYVFDEVLTQRNARVWYYPNENIIRYDVSWAAVF